MTQTKATEITSGSAEKKPRERLDPRVALESGSAFLDPPATALYIGYKERTLREWRRTGHGPHYVRVGGPTGHVRYERAELDRWMREHGHTSTASESVARKAS